MKELNPDSIQLDDDFIFNDKSKQSILVITFHSVDEILNDQSEQEEYLTDF